MTSKKIDNPMGTNGFEFIEFTSQHRGKLEEDFKKLGFVPIAKHRSKRGVVLYRQGEINFILNTEAHSHAEEFARQHGDSVCAMAFRVKDADKAFQRAIKLGAKPFEGAHHGPGELNIPAIYGIGGSLIYFVDKYQGGTLYDIDFLPIPGAPTHPEGNGLTYIDHLTHNVNRGQMDTWASFYETLFNFREIRYFDIKGKKTGLISRALTSPCGKIRIPLNESTDDKSQIEEFLHEFKGEGIQHLALGTNNIYESVEKLKDSGIIFLDTPDTYFAMIKDRISWHKEDVTALKAGRILIDGGKKEEEGLLLQIFTANMMGPVFFEIIQRKGNEGFGEGNFQALFEAIERDQMERGVL